MKSVSAVKNGTACERDGPDLSPLVIFSNIILAGAIGLFAFLVGQEKALSVNQFHAEPMAVAPLERPVIVTVKLHETATAGDLSITLTEVQQQPDTKKYQVWAKVSIKGQSDMQIRKAEEGYAVRYPEEHGYTIELIKATADSGKFSITKNP